MPLGPLQTLMLVSLLVKKECLKSNRTETRGCNLIVIGETSRNDSCLIAQESGVAEGGACMKFSNLVRLRDLVIILLQPPKG